MKLVPLNHAPSLQEALEVVAELRKDLEEGRITCFVAAGVGDNDQTYAYTGVARRTARLHLIGAAAHMVHMLHHEEL